MSSRNVLAGVRPWRAPLAVILFSVSGWAAAQSNTGLGEGEQPQGGVYSGPITPGAPWSETLDRPPAFYWSTELEPGPIEDGPWTFDGSFCVFVTDAFQKGDRFAVYDNGELLGETSDVPEDVSTTGDPVVAYADATYSSGAFPVGPGSHSITIEVIDNPYAPSPGQGFIMVDDCPTGGGGTRTTFNVTKNFTDNNPGTVDVAISCNTGLPLDQVKPISETEPVEFVVTEFDNGELDCVISEGSNTGYAPEYDDGFTVNDSGCEFLDLQSGLELDCAVTNTPIPVTVTVNKEWLYTNTGNNEVNDDFRFKLECDAVIEGGYSIGGGEYAAHYDGSGDDSHDFSVHPTWGGNTCTATETTYDSAVESDAGECESLDIDIAQGDECTITNTVFFEGIPTLSTYGLALLALLMAGVGFVGFRRYA